MWIRSIRCLPYFLLKLVPWDKSATLYVVQYARPLSKFTSKVREERVERQFFIQSRVMSNGKVDSSANVVVTSSSSQQQRRQQNVVQKPEFRPEAIGNFLDQKRLGVNATSSLYEEEIINFPDPLEQNFTNYGPFVNVFLHWDDLTDFLEQSYKVDDGLTVMQKADWL